MNYERTPIYRAMVLEAVQGCLAVPDRGKRTIEWKARLQKRAKQIEKGTCPPWRTDPTIPCGYDGVRFK